VLVNRIEREAESAIKERLSLIKSDSKL